MRSDEVFVGFLVGWDEVFERAKWKRSRMCRIFDLWYESFENLRVEVLKKVWIKLVEQALKFVNKTLTVSFEMLKLFWIVR